MANLSWISSNPDYINQMIRNTQVTLSNNYNDLDNIPIIKITSTTNNPQKIWVLKEGLYMIDGVVQVDNNTSYEVSNLLISMTARLENGKYILSAFIPYLRGLFEYILKTNSTEYEQHQKIVLMIKNDTLALDNETIYTPIEDYHPATKKYVDDKANEIVTELDRMGVNKENLESLSKENRIRDIKLQALLSETSDRNITIEENVRYFDMPLSIDNGIVTINEIVGETLVNVCDQEESVAITKSYTVENENHIPLQGEYDGSCRPVVYGNTLVNHNADWDDSLQTGVETSANGTEDVQVEGIKGQEVSVVVEGNTVLNHALGKTSAVVDSVEDNLITKLLSTSKNIIFSNGYIERLNDQKDTSWTFDTSLFKPNTIYTVYYDIIINTLDSNVTLINNTNMGRKFIQTGFIGSESYTFTSPDTISSPVEGWVDNINATGDLKFSIKIYEGDHTTNPKYVNSNNGNYVDLTVANNMSSVVEIEGRTLVNVCDKKDPIAITKSYTVENSGNHIALQGEYDGKCRPVIHGNTMVNLIKSRLDTQDNIITYTVTSSDPYYFGDENVWIKNIDNTKTHTIILNILENTVGVDVRIYNYGTYAYFPFRPISIPAGTTGMQIYTTTQKTENNQSPSDWLCFPLGHGEGATIGGVFKYQAMIFEGDLTQTPELIPTEYVEGLKSSFEDNLVTQAMVDSGEESSENLGKYKVEYKVTGKNKFDEKYFISHNCNFQTYLLKGDYTFTGTFYTEKGRVGLWFRDESGSDIIEPQVLVSNGKSTIKFTNPKSQLVKFVRHGWDSSAVYLSCENLQLEEGSTATEYEPYKEYTKTFYLNSPLLEGDTIEDINGKATHVKRYHKTVFNGSEDWTLHSINEYGIANFNGKTPYNNVGKGFSDRFNITNIKIANAKSEGLLLAATSTNSCYIRKYSSIASTVEQFKQWLSENPTTLVYELASPIYEPISDESILCDSYVNGHLDFDSAVPIEKVQFIEAPYCSLTYLKDNTNYTIQFESDNKGYLDWLNIKNSSGVRGVDVIKGVNKFNLTTGNESSLLRLYIAGIGFNASNIVVTEAIDKEFGYFEGLKSSYECEVTEDGKYKVDVKVIGKNKWSYGNFLSRDVVEVFIYLTPGNYTISSSCLKVYESSPVIVINGKSYMLTKSHTINIEKEGNYKIALYSNGYNYQASLNNPIDFTNIQIEEGTVATSYEPYFESTKTFYLNSPLLEGDKIVTKNGKVYHYHKMGMVVLDGSEDNNTTRWTMYPLKEEYPNVAGFYIGLGNNIVKDGIGGISDRFKTLERDIPGILNTNEEGYVTSGNKEGGTDYHKIIINKSKLSTVDVNGFKKWLQANPTTVVYELASPYYELIDEYSNTILNIPKNVAHLTHTSAVPVNNTVFTNYKDELNVLEANTQYRVMFDCDKANIPFTVTLGGTSQEVTSKNGTHSLLITTPSELVDKNLVIDGIGRCGIDNIRIFKGDVEYDYVKGLWSGYEEKLIKGNLMRTLKDTDTLYNSGASYYISGVYTGHQCSLDISSNAIKINTGTCTNDIILGINLSRLNLALESSKTYTVIFNSDTYWYSFEIGKQEYPSNTDNRKMYFGSKGNLYYSKFTYKPTDNYICFGKFKNNTTTKTIWDMVILEGDWTDNPPTYEEVMANEGKYAVKVKLDNPNATIFGKGGKL